MKKLQEEKIQVSRQIEDLIAMLAESNGMATSAICQEAPLEIWPMIEVMIKREDKNVLFLLDRVSSEDFMTFLWPDNAPSFLMSLIDDLSRSTIDRCLEDMEVKGIVCGAREKGSSEEFQKKTTEEARKKVSEILEKK